MCFILNEKRAAGMLRTARARQGGHAKGRLNYASLCWFIAANRIAT